MTKQRWRATTCERQTPHVVLPSLHCCVCVSVWLTGSRHPSPSQRPLSLLLPSPSTAMTKKGRGDVGWPTTSTGSRDGRYTMPRVLNPNGKPDRRYNPFDSPSFGDWNPLTQGRSQYYTSQPVQPTPGVYEIATRIPHTAGRPNIVYAGLDSHLGSRGNDHGRCGPDNIADLMQRAGNQGLNTVIHYAQAANPNEARAQELYLLDGNYYSWNAQNNEGRFSGE